MNKETLELLDYNEIKSIIKTYTLSGLGKKNIDKMRPYTDIDIIRKKLKDVEEAKKMILDGVNPTLYGISDINQLLDKSTKGMILKADELIALGDLIRGGRLLKKYMLKMEYTAPNLALYSLSMLDLEFLEDEINAMILNGKIRDQADPQLNKIRKKILNLEEQIDIKASSILNRKDWSQYLQENYVTKKNGHYVIPVKVAYKNKVSGEVIEYSASGSTAFIEPNIIKKQVANLQVLKGLEKEIEYQILAYLTGFILENEKEIKINIDVIGEYDFIFAKAKYAAELKAELPILKDEEKIMIKNGRHPLISENVVPLNFEIGENYRTLVITGPNTGGKTVTLKTIGLLQLMVQSGILPPSNKDSVYTVLEDILVDIGDSQDLKNSLSTFSGHMNRLVRITNTAKPGILVLSDEIGTGTDPREGSALGMAILESLYEKGALTVVTTHYGEIKDFSQKCIGFENARMLFDKKTLKPKYILEIGKSGYSNAFWISEHLGLDRKILAKAKKYSNSIGSIKTEFPEEIELKHKIKKQKPNKTKVFDSNFEKGDRVIDLNKKSEVIFFEGPDKFGIVNLFNDRNKLFYTEHISRIKLKLKANELYPIDYDLNQIFISWKKRKLEKDILKGKVSNPKEISDILKKIVK